MVFLILILGVLVGLLGLGLMGGGAVIYFSEKEDKKAALALAIGGFLIIGCVLTAVIALFFGFAGM